MIIRMPCLHLKHMYVNHIIILNHFQETSDSDGYIPQKRAGVRGRKKKVIPSQPSEASPPASKDAESIRVGKWTEEEESLFLESLELYGRDWDKVNDLQINCS